MKRLKILLLEDNESDAILLERALRKNDLDHELVVIERKGEFVKILEEYDPDVVLSDHQMPGFTAIEALQIARKHKPDLPFIMVTGAVSEEFAVECMKAGMDDYILKRSLVRLAPAIQNVLSRINIHREKEMVESLHNKLRKAYDDINETNRNIKDSINYAKLIQDAMLPDRKILEKYFAESFIINKPKDIVSGDFYWFWESGGKLLVAVADCTGHGVPGALMSMIGYGLLNEIVNVYGVTDPAKILARLNFGVRKALKQNVPDNRRCDGMDMAMCLIDRGHNTIKFAGANRHLVLARDRELEVVKGDRFGIGGIYSETAAEYKSSVVKIKKGDVIYLFTDGYSDQFGGANGSRMMTKNLLKILQRSLSFGLTEQEHVLKHWLQSWQRGFLQTDDILVLGAQF